MWAMLRRVFLVAKREYKHHAQSKGFWLTMVAVPIVAALAGLIPQWVQENKPARAFVMIDQSGGAILTVVDAAIARDNARRALAALKDYAAENIPPESIPMLSPLAPARGELTNDDVAVFQAWGGVEKAQEILPALVRPKAPPFVAPGPRFVRVATPAEIDVTADPAAIGAALAPYLRFEKPVAATAPAYLSAAIVVPRDYLLTRPTTAIQYWTVNINDFDLQTLAERALTQEAQRAMYEEQGMSREAVAAIEQRRVALQSFSPDKADSGGEVQLRDRLLNIVPLGLAILLWMSIFTVANLLLLGVIEERSNKLIEVLLSSVSAEEFMAGKLLGIAGIGLTILTAWLTVGLLIMTNSSGPSAAFAHDAIDLILSGPYIPAFAFYFVVGYLTIASVFLGLGSVCNSQQEAQSLLTPLIFVLMLPFFLLMPMLEDPNGVIATTAGWIPVYTPFVMMVRLSTNPPWTEVLATGAVTLVFSLIVLWAMARLFRSAVLRTGQPPRLVEIWRMMRRGVS
jgi:ABC-2 type transport system permease protein